MIIDAPKNKRKTCILLPIDFTICNFLQCKAGARIGLRAAVYSTLVMFVSDRIREMMFVSDHVDNMTLGEPTVLLGLALPLLPLYLLSAIPVGQIS